MAESWEQGQQSGKKGILSLFIDWFQASIGMGLEGDPETVAQKRRVAMLVFGSLLAIAMLTTLGVSAFFSEKKAVALVDYGAAVIIIVNLLYFKKTQNYEQAAGITSLMASLLFFYLFISGGVYLTGPFWCFILPLLNCFLLGSKKGSRASVLFFAAIILFFMVDNLIPFAHIYQTGFKVRFAMALMLVAGYTHLFEKYREDVLSELSSSNLELAGKISELSEVQTALKEGEEKYRNLVERANDGIIIVQDFKLCYTNPQMVKMLGYSFDEVLGKNFMDYLQAQEIDTISKQHEARMRGEEFVTKSESVLVHRNGKEWPVEFNSCQINYEGRPASLVIVRDISERKKIELEQVKARQAAEEASRAKSEFLANMSHELRTPLNHIMGFSDLVAQEKAGSLNETQKEYLQYVLKSSRHLLELINDILDLSKIESGKMDLEYQWIKSKSFFEGCINMIRHKADQHHLKVETEIDVSFPSSFIADERKIKQVFYNLLANAAKFTLDEGSVTITAKLLKNDGFLHFEIVDDGVGIAEPDLERIFVPFEQADGSSSRKFQGTGLGLPLSRRIIEMHGGTIVAESAGLGQGSSFRFTVPLLVELPAVCGE